MVSSPVDARSSKSAREQVSMVLGWTWVLLVHDWVWCLVEVLVDGCATKGWELKLELEPMDFNGAFASSILRTFQK